jgi:hypothetical protein
MIIAGGGGGGGGELESQNSVFVYCVLRFNQKLEAHIKVIALKLKRVSI